MWASIASIGITARVPERPPGGRRSAWDGGGIGLEKVELIGRIFVNRTTDYYQEHEKESACD